MTRTIVEIGGRGRLPLQGLQGAPYGLELSLKQLDVAQMVFPALQQGFAQVLPGLRGRLHLAAPLCQSSQLFKLLVFGLLKGLECFQVAAFEGLEFLVQTDRQALGMAGRVQQRLLQEQAQWLGQQRERLSSSTARLNADFAQFLVP